VVELSILLILVFHIQIYRSSFLVLTAGTNAGLCYFSGSALTMTSISLTAWNLVASTGFGFGGVFYFSNSISTSVILFSRVSLSVKLKLTVEIYKELEMLLSLFKYHNLQFN
jgi:hypothetical protein